MAPGMRRTGVAVVVLGLLLSATLPTHAAAILTVEEVGHDVVVSGRGTLNLADLSPLDESLPVVSNAEVFPRFAKIMLGADPSHYLPVDDYVSPLVLGPTNFGPAVGGGHAFTQASSGTGDRFGIIGNTGSSLGNFIVVPDGYVSGDPLSATSVYAGETLRTLGFTPGIYVWTWGTGINADSFTVQVIPGAAVPEPVSLSLLSVGLAGVAVRRWRRTAVGAQRK